jgi:hypothetical protein
LIWFCIFCRQRRPYNTSSLKSNHWGHEIKSTYRSHTCSILINFISFLNMWLWTFISSCDPQKIPTQHVICKVWNVVRICIWGILVLSGGSKISLNQFLWKSNSCCFTTLRLQLCDKYLKLDKSLHV